MKGPLAVLAGLVLGILLADRLGPGSAGPLLAGALALGSIAASGRWGTTAVGVLLLLAAALLGCAVEQRALHGRVHSPLAAAIRQERSGTADVTLAEDPGGARYSTEVLVRVTRFRARDAGGRTVLAVASGDAQSALLVLDAGDRLRLHGRLEPLSGYSTRLRWRHAVGTLRVDDVAALAPPADPWLRLANGARRAVLRGAVVMPGTPRALLAGFVLGDTRAIPPEIVSDFRGAGLSHLLAVSGANVAFALAIVAPLLRRMPRGARLVVGIAVLVLFGAMTRWEPSVARAIAMAGLVLLARALGRPATAPRVLVLAASGLLLVDPFLLHSIGFLLSCGACAGIVLFAGPIGRRVPGPAPLGEALAVTAAAQIGVAPVLLATFGTVPLVALPANLLAAPFVGPLTIWGLLASAAGGLLGRVASGWLELPTLAMLEGITLIAHQAARVPLAVGSGPAVAATVVVTSAWGLRVRHRAAGRLRARGRRLRGQGERSDPA